MPSSSSSSSDAGDAGDAAASSSSYVFYAQRPEWADVTPLPQDDGNKDDKDAQPVVRIAYDKKFVDTFDYFRAIYRSGEVSERALELTQTAAELNPANYTVWHHRRVLLKALNYDLDKELEYIGDVVEQQPKNYQVWQHRRALIEWTQDASKEIAFINEILADDAKNYHAWQHRQWVNKTFDLFDGELNYVDELLEDDLRNNSAWNQRHFVVRSLLDKADKEDKDKADKSRLETLKDELEYAEKAIRKVPGNESAWNYLWGLLDLCQDGKSCRSGLLADMTSFCDAFYLKEKDSVQRQLRGVNGVTANLLAAMVDVRVERMDDDDGDSMAKEEKEALLARAKELCRLLATEVDVTRREYWSFMERDLTGRFGGQEEKMKA